MCPHRSQLTSRVIRPGLAEFEVKDNGAICSIGRTPIETCMTMSVKSKGIREDQVSHSVGSLRELFEDGLLVLLPPFSCLLIRVCEPLDVVDDVFLCPLSWGEGKPYEMPRAGGQLICPPPVCW